MDYRKLISFGKGGYVISVPKDWVVENKLEKGSFLSIERNNGSLVLVPGKDSNEKTKEISEKTIEIDGLSFNKIRRLLISAYLNAHDLVYLKGEQLKEKLPSLKKQVHELIAFEIIESTKNKLVIQDFLDFDIIDLEKTFRKMDMVIRSILSDIKLQDKSLYDNIIDRDDEVSRYYYLVIKATKKFITDPRHKNNKYKINDLLDYWQLSVSLETIADELTRFVETLKLDVDKKIEKKLFEIFTNIEQLFLKTMAAFYKKDPDLAQELRFDRSKIFEDCDTLYKAHWNKKQIAVILEIFKNITKNIQLILRRVYDK